MKRYHIANEFSDVPGGRYRSDGLFSGQEFREDVLEPLLRVNEPVCFILDGVFGFPISFVDESFAQLQRKYKYLDLLQLFSFVCLEDVSEVHEFETCIRKARTEGINLSCKI